MRSILVADSGSTKTSWELLTGDQGHAPILTQGINPYYQTEEDIVKIVQSLTTEIKFSPDSIFFYGAGCGNDEKKNLVRSSIKEIFPESIILIESDLLGAARSLCQDREGIACILGTGSNSCFYDGTGIVDHISPLGYILGDEGSGAVLGKKIVSDILKNQLPKIVSERFFETYAYNVNSILDSAYKQPFPNRYLAQFSKFIYSNLDIPEVENIVLESFKEFISRNILQYKRSKDVEINFTGSIAFYFKPQLIRVMETFGLKPNQITQSPLENMVKYHLHHIEL